MRGARWEGRAAGECGQATVEWIGILLLVALALAALARVAPRADGDALATTLAHSITRPASRDRPPNLEVVGIRGGKRNDSPPPGAGAFTAPPLVPLPRPTTQRSAPRRPSSGALLHRSAPRSPSSGALLQWARRTGERVLTGRAPLQQLRRGAGAAWRRAWYLCLVYERFRWGLLHPESRFPGYTMPPSEVLRIANDCISPVDLVRDWSLLQQTPGRPPG
jgi:hypothetical protein